MKNVMAMEDMPIISDEVVISIEEEAEVAIDMAVEVAVAMLIDIDMSILGDQQEILTFRLMIRMRILRFYSRIISSVDIDLQVSFWWYDSTRQFGNFGSG